MPYSRPTLVLAHLYSVLESRGIKHINAIDLDLEYTLHDRNIDYYLTRAAERVNKFKPDIICISCKAAQFPFSALFSQKYKKAHPNTKIVMGGWMPTLAPETVLQLSDCDAVIRGEGERSLPELIKRINEGPLSIKGISYPLQGNKRKVIHNPNSKVLSRDELDNLPLPRYDVLPPIERYQPSLRKRFSVEASRGCPNHQCIFCWNSTSNCDTSWRSKSPERVVYEIKYLVDNYGARVIVFTDDNFGAEPQWLSEFTSLMMIEFKPGEIEYIASLRVDNIDPHMLKDLYTSGLRRVFHGIESGSPRHWKTLQKNFAPNITKEYIKNLVKNEVESGIIPTCSFILAFPYESEEDIDETIALCKELADLGSIFSIQIIAPNKGTVLFERYQHLIKPKDLYEEYGESENLCPELRAVFGKKLDPFLRYMPDSRWVQTPVPPHVFKNKFSLLVEIASYAYKGYIDKLRLKIGPSDSHTNIKVSRNNVVHRFIKALKRLHRS